MSVHHSDDQLLIGTSPPKNTFAPIVPPRTFNTEKSKPCVGTKLEGLLLDSDSDEDFDPRAEEPIGNKSSNDLFGFEPSNSTQPAFNSANITERPAPKLSSHTSPPPLRE